MVAAAAYRPKGEIIVMRDAQICQWTENIVYDICTHPDLSISTAIIVSLIMILTQEIPADSPPQKTSEDRDITGRDTYR
jgi:hypothetical protein